MQGGDVLVERRGDAEHQQIKACPRQDLFGEPLIPAAVAEVFWMRGPHGHHHGPYGGLVHLMGSDHGL